VFYRFSQKNLTLEEIYLPSSYCITKQYYSSTNSRSDINSRTGLSPSLVLKTKTHSSEGLNLLKYPSKFAKLQLFLKKDSVLGYFLFTRRY